MKYYLLLVSLSICALCDAQITLTDVDFPPSGTFIQYTNCSFPASAQVGANQLWDWSMVQDSTFESWGTLISATNVPCTPYNSNTTHAFDHGWQYGNLVGVTPYLVEFFGSHFVGPGSTTCNPGQASTTCQDPERILEFPLTFGSTWTDDVDCVDWSITSMHRNYSDTYVVDGHGDLILPSGTNLNVLKVHRYRVGWRYHNGNSWADTISSDHFYKSGFALPIASSYQRHSVGTSGVAQGVVINQSNGNYLNNMTVGVEEVLDEGIAIDLIPNPSSGLTLASFKTKGNTIIQVFDSKGTRLLELQKGNLPKGIHQEQLDLRKLNDGIYTVLVSSQNGATGSSRLVINR